MWWRCVDPSYPSLRTAAFRNNTPRSQYITLNSRSWLRADTNNPLSAASQNRCPTYSRKMKKSSLLTCLTLLSSSSVAFANSLEARAPATNKTVIIQMFEWNWDSVAAECTNFVGPAGYGFVQGKFASLLWYIYILNILQWVRRRNTSLGDNGGPIISPSRTPWRPSVAIVNSFKGLSNSSVHHSSSDHHLINQHGFHLSYCGSEGYCGYHLQSYGRDR